MKKAALLIARCGWAGLSPVAPGSVGALVGFIPVFALHRWPFAYACAGILLFMAGVRSGTVVEKMTGEKDPPQIVIDEAVSMMITCAAIPLTGVAVLLGFIFNRLMDIVKPYPADRLQHCRGGWGVMMDDVVAGFYSNLLLRGVLALWK